MRVLRVASVLQLIAVLATSSALAQPPDAPPQSPPAAGAQPGGRGGRAPLPPLVNTDTLTNNPFPDPIPASNGVIVKFVESPR